MSSCSIPDHPAIAMALATGYPHPVQEHYVTCTDCGTKLSGDEDVFIWDGDIFCEKCLKANIESNFSTKELADLIGIVYQSAYALQEVV